MTGKFSANSIVRTRTSGGGNSLEITLADQAGRPHTVSIARDLAHSLAGALEEFARMGPGAASISTKMPKTFAVGTGRYERVVLLRFEDDIPYGLDADQAAELGHALINRKSTRLNSSH